MSVAKHILEHEILGCECGSSAPPTVYASYYNNNNGSTNAVVPDIPEQNRRVANPNTGSYALGDWVAGSLQGCISGQVLNFNTPEATLFDNDTGVTLEANVYDHTGVTKLATHVTGVISGNTDATVDNIRIRSTNWATNFDKFKARILVTINLDTILASNSGRCKVEIIQHNDTLGAYDKTQEFFYDTQPQTAALTGLTFSENTPVISWLSGVQYYAANSSFNIGLTDIDYINADSYPTNFINIHGANIGLPGLDLEGLNLTSWTTNDDNTNASFSKTDWQINAPNIYVLGNQHVSAYPIDWANGTEINSASLNMAVNTYTDSSTRTFEGFSGEVSRLESDLSTSWLSNNDLSSYDGGNSLQIIPEKLKYPNFNYTSTSPNAGSQRDYSSLSNDRYYYREMHTSGATESNGLFEIFGVTEADITSDDFKLEISKDNGTTWYNCNEPYAGGVLADGDGCRVEDDIYTMTLNNKLKFTFGTGGFSSSVHLRISMPDTSTVEVESIELTDW